MPTTIDTSTHASLANGTGFPNEEKAVRAPNGDLWVMFDAGGDTIEFHRSTDDGGTFGTSATSNIAATTSSRASLRFDLSGNAHVSYCKGTTARVFYRRGTVSGNVITWGSELQSSLLGSGAQGCHLGVHSEGAGWKAHIVVNTSENGTTRLTTYWRVNIASDGTATSDMTPVGVGQSHAGSAISSSQQASIYVDGSKNLHLVYYRHASGSSPTLWHLYYRKAVYSAGTWTWGTIRTVSSTAVVPRRPCSTFDGSRTVAAMGEASTTSIQVVERDAGDTTTADRSPGALSSNVLSTALAADGDGNIWLFALHGTSNNGTLSYNRFERATAMWDGWTQLVASGGNIRDDTLNAKRDGSGSRIEVVYTTGTGSPFNVVYNSVALNSPPLQPSWVNTDNQAADVAASLLLGWVFNDPDDGDTQSAYALSRQIGAGSVEYWNAGTSSWGGTETKNTSGTTEVTLASSWGTDPDANHKYRVKTWDQADEEGPYGPELTVIPSAKVNPTIDEPGATWTTGTLTGEWTVSEQSQYRARLLDDSDMQLESSGWVSSTGLRAHTFELELVTATDYKFEITTRNTEGLASNVVTQAFTTSFTPPGTPTLAATPVDAEGLIRVAIDNPSGGTTVTENRLRRRVVGESGDGTRIAVGLAVDGTYTDWAVGSSINYEYMVVAVGDNGTFSPSGWIS